MTRLIFITGTDTGVGKTLLTVLLTENLRKRNLRVAALKPFCSGGREDAEALQAALGGTLSLDEINPWHFSRPIAPLIAARQAARQIRLHDATKFIGEARRRFPITLVEGAGGLLSPLGEAFDSRDLIQSLRAVPIVVGPNRLGIINQMRLTLEALPKQSSAQAQIVLMSPLHPDSSTPTNAKLLSEFVEQNRIHVLPWIKSKRQFTTANIRKPIDAVLKSILK